MVALPGKIVKLNKSLFGLRQASRRWYAMLKKCLSSLGFELNKSLSGLRQASRQWYAILRKCVLALG